MYNINFISYGGLHKIHHFVVALPKYEATYSDFKDYHQELSELHHFSSVPIRLAPSRCNNGSHFSVPQTHSLTIWSYSISFTVF